MTVRSALRIAVVPGPADRRRLIGMAAGVAVGVMLAALLWAGFTGLGDRSERSTWTSPSSADWWTPETTLTPGQVAARGEIDVFDGRAISVLYVYGADDPAIDIPGTRDGVPAGTAWVSPALATLIESVPSAELGDRFGTVRGTLPDRVLAGPDALVAVVGVDESRVSGSYAIVSEFTGYRYASFAYEAIALLGAIAVLIPVAMLLGVVTSFGSIDRSARMRAFHLLGATAADRARFAAVEAGGVALVGTIAGVLLAWVAAIPTSLVSINGSRLFPDDVRLEPWEALVAVVVVPLAFALVAGVRAARADAQPSSVRDRAEKKLSPWRIAPLGVGLALMLFSFVGPGRMIGVYGLVAAFTITAIGIVMIGPILTQAIARLAHRRAQSAAGVMAYARIERNPRQIFRAVSGVVIAVFLVSLFMSGVTSVREGVAGSGEGYLADDVLMVSLRYPTMTFGDDPMDPAVAAGRSAQNVAVADAIEHLEGVTGVARIYASPTTGGYASTRDDLAAIDIVTTEEFPSVNLFPFSDPVVIAGESGGIDETQLIGLFVRADNPSALEQARTVVAESGVVAGTPATRAEYSRLSNSTATEYRTLAILGILVAAGVSAVALAAATVSAVRDRRRTLGLMRLTGMPFGAIKGIMMREAVVPLAAAVALAAVVGYGVGAIIVVGLSFGARSITPPPLEYYLVIALTLGLSLLAVLTAFPAARRATSGEVTRFE